jgi:hypothetical protein
MRVDIFAFALFFCTNAFSQVAPDSDKPPSNTYRAAEKFGFKASDVYRLNREKKKEIDVYGIGQAVAYSFEDNNLLAAEYADEALENMLRRADGVLRAFGKQAVADDIATEYSLYFRGWYTSYVFGSKEIGDHKPMSEWLDKVHKKIEQSIGEFWCKFFHFHDIFILNYGIPVVFSPAKYQLDDYKDHFSGHIIAGFFWEHHGVAGVTAYWVVEGLCSGFTGGVGLVSFACGPIANFASHITDKRIAPPIAERIWNRANP